MQAIKNRIVPILGGLKDGLKKSKGLEKADRVVLGLTHSGSQLLEQTLKRIESNPSDVIGRVGRSVLERAQQIRGQMAIPTGLLTRSSDKKVPSSPTTRVATKEKRKVSKSATKVAKKKK